LPLGALLAAPFSSPPEARAALTRAGFSHVKVSTGDWLPVDEWRPYAGIPEERLSFVLDETANVVIDRPAEGVRLTRLGFALGCWPLRRMHSAAGLTVRDVLT